MSTKVHQVYKKKDGTRVAGVTTILGILSKPALIHWAWNLGCKGEDYRKVRDKAASIGTIGHYLIECHLKKQTPKLDDYSKNDIDKAETAFLAYLDFEKNHHLKVLGSEIQLVSEKYGYGGTIDCYAELDGKTALIDFKTSNGVWPEMRCQVAAYAELLREHGKEVDECHLLRIDKDTGEFHHHPMKDLTREWKLFKGLCKIYPLKTAIWKKK